MKAASHAVIGGIATIEEKVEENANSVAGHLHITPSVTSTTGANIVVGQDILLGSPSVKDQQTEEYSTHGDGKTDQIMPTNIANESAICDSKEEVTTTLNACNM